MYIQNRMNSSTRALSFVLAKIALGYLFFAVFAISVYPQSNDTLRGRVTDVNQALLPGAAITLSNLATGLDRTTIADANGNFTFAGLRDGRYRVTVSATGFAMESRIIEGLNSPSITFTLQPSSLTETVTVVSGSRQEELREELNTKVEVVGHNRIRDTGYESVAEVLQEVPGVVTRRGSQGAGAAGEQIQGIDSRQVLVLFDGQPIIGARGIKRGAINLDRQSVGTLDRIEVVKGAASALYGSDAIGGVINQISQDVTGPLTIGLSTSGGSLGRFDSRGDVGIGGDKYSLFFSGERHKQNDFDLTPTTFDTTGAKYERTDAFAKLKYRVTDKFALSAWAKSYWNRESGRSRGEEGNQVSVIDEDSQNFNLAADWNLNEKVAIQTRGYFSRFDEIGVNTLVPNTRPIAPGNLFERFGKIDSSLSAILGEHQLLQAGGEWTTDRYRGLNRLASDSGHSVDTASVWAQDKISLLNRVTLTVGARFDHNSIFGNATSPKVGVNLRVHDLFRVRASYGRGFRAPDLGQLYYRFLNPTNFYQVIGNPNLKPEYANSYQVGSEFNSRNRKARLGVNLFYNDIQDLIDSVSLGLIATQQQLNEIAAREGIDLTLFRPSLGRLLFRYKNITQAVTRGVELDSDFALGKGFNFSGAYTYLIARDTVNSLPLTGRHKHQGHIRLAWESNQRIGFRWNLRGTFYGKYVNSIGTATTPDVIPPGFALWDFYAAKRLYRGFEFFAAIDNFTDSRDPNIGKFSPTGTPLSIYRPEFGRTYRVGLRFNWSAEKR